MSIIIPSDTKLICSGRIELSLSIGPNKEVIVKPIREEGTKYTFTIDDDITITSTVEADDDITITSSVEADDTTSIASTPITGILKSEPAYLNICGRHVHNVDGVNVKRIVELMMLHDINRSNSNDYYVVHKEDTFPFRLIGNYMLWEYETSEDTDRWNVVTYPIELHNAIRRRYIWEPFSTKSVSRNIKIGCLPYLNNMLIKTGAVMAGSYPLREVASNKKGNYWEPGDADIFGLTLEFLRDVIDIFTLVGIKFRLYLRRLGHVDSYKLVVKDITEDDMGCTTDVILNYLHIAHDGDDRPIDKDMDADLHKAKIIKFILTSFDIAACASYYDGTHIYYNEGVDSMTSEVRGSCERRMNKYKKRGFKLTGDLKDYTDQMYE
jgi:hypothetical protein